MTKSGAGIEESKAHVGDIQILLLMSLTDIISDTINLDKGTVEVLVVDIVDNAVHPNTIVFVPGLVLLKVIKKYLMSTVEVGIVATHLRLLYVHGQFLFYVVGISTNFVATEKCQG